MTVALDHVILPTNDQAASAELLSRMLGLPPGVVVGHFICIALGNGVTVDVMQSDDNSSLHLAFLVDDDTFDRGLAILRSEHISHWRRTARRHQSPLRRSRRVLRRPGRQQPRTTHAIDAAVPLNHRPRDAMG